MILSVASGKGGTGKTLVATSLALSLKEKYIVRILDCDVEEPNDHVFLKPIITGSEEAAIPVPVIDQQKCTHCGLCAEICTYNAIAAMKYEVLVFPELCHGCGACSYLCPENAISEESSTIGVVEWGKTDTIHVIHGKLAIGKAMAPPIIRKVKEFINDDDINIIDASPGTSCPVIEAIKGSDFCLLVTEPTPFGLNDLIMAVEAVKQLNIPYGIVLNRVGIGDMNTEEYCQREGIPILMSIPLDMEIASLYSRGINLIEGKPRWKGEFIKLFDTIMDRLYERDSRFKR
jgi:MinD superfamily P-loop ATPase